ncbi:MAG: hypothetical protein A2283_01845 [Lentisphaerae bacterium RIFOXYA12_FULL_48_11]|nr:MAG: hypothetical protein A2283_01845 [Lentisphaerae bacterium RIFOXYA12_FULL_48_11]
MKCLLLALTGFGNAALEGICGSGHVSEVMVITRKEKGKYPYYECDPLEWLCSRKQVHCHADITLKDDIGRRIISKFSPDIILVATFDQIVPLDIISLARNMAINIHPSLLPKYKGPTPTNWAVAHGERFAGITFHGLTAKIDAGPILWQEKERIEDLTDGEVRHVLARLCCRQVPLFLDVLSAGKVKEIQLANECAGGYFPKIYSKKGLEILQSGRFYPSCIKRALTPYPGVLVLESLNGDYGLQE